MYLSPEYTITHCPSVNASSSAIPVQLVGAAIEKPEHEESSEVPSIPKTDLTPTSLSTPLRPITKP